MEEDNNSPHPSQEDDPSGSNNKRKRAVEEQEPARKKKQATLDDDDLHVSPADPFVPTSPERFYRWFDTYRSLLGTGLDKDAMVEHANASLWPTDDMIYDQNDSQYVVCHEMDVCFGIADTSCGRCARPLCHDCVTMHTCPAAAGAANDDEDEDY